MDMIGPKVQARSKVSQNVAIYVVRLGLGVKGRVTRECRIVFYMILPDYRILHGVMTGPSLCI